MAECKNRIRIDLRRAIWSGGFLIAIVATVVVQAQAVFEEYLKTKGDVLYYLSLTLQTGKMQVLMPSIASLCFSGVFFQDYHDGFFVYEQIRGNVNTYLLSKAVACWISAFLAVVLGMCIFIFCIALKFPLLSDASYVNMNAYQTDSFGELLAHHHYIAFIAIRILTRGISAGAWAVVALAVSPFCRERFILHSAPFLLSYFSSWILTRAGFRLTFLKLDTGYTSGAYQMHTVGQATWVILLVYGITTILGFAIFSFGAKRRMAYGYAKNCFLPF